ncbi:glycosyltransferase family 39 protein [bacterium]|nr:glycosyltransferase family 39 protein [bacterium]
MNKKWFSNKYNLILILILLIALGIRLYYFYLTSDQALWWDEGEYLLKAKHWAFDTSDFGWNPLREIFMSLVWAGLFKIGFGEVGLRFTELLFSFFGVYLTYLVGKEIFNKKIGLISSFLMSVFYLHLFFTQRFLMDLPATTIALLSIYLFWKGYYKKAGNKYIYLSGLFLGIGFLIHYSTAFLVIILGIYLLITKKLNFLRDKRIWIVALIILLVISPYFIWSYINYDSISPRFSEVSSATSTQERNSVGWVRYIGFFPMYLQTPLFIIFILSSAHLLFNVLLGFDLIWKNKEKSLSKYLLLFIWMLIPILAYSYVSAHTGGHAEPRYLMMIFPAVFYVIGLGMLKFYYKFKKYNKIIGVVIIILLLLIGGYYQVKFADSLIKDKLYSFSEIKSAGFWIKENSNKEDKILSNNNQMPFIYYTERFVTTFGKDEEMTIQKLDELKPKYIVVTGYYPSAQWTYEIAQNNPELFTPVNVFFLKENPQQPVIIIYEVKYI